MSLEFDAVYGFDVDADLDDDVVDAVILGTELTRIYGGDPIPGFDESAIGVSLSLGSDTEKELFDKIQEAKKKLTPSILKKLEDELDIYGEPRVIILASASW